uniref:HEAT repeat domain-containing protein n=1 Tax=Magallana gigas TaxID=29159 RepID=A0A8W8JAG1_MAGGI
MCPCRVKKDLSDFWARVIEMADDEDVLVRKQVLHTLCDGSPAHLEFQVVEMLEIFNRDKDAQIRRTAHKVFGVTQAGLQKTISVDTYRNKYTPDHKKGS